MQAQVKPRIQQRGQPGRDHFAQQVGRRGDVDRAGNAGRAGPRAGQSRFRRVEAAPDGSREVVGHRGRSHTPRMAVEQGTAQLRLERCDVLRRRRLGDADCPGRLAQ